LALFELARLCLSELAAALPLGLPQVWRTAVLVVQPEVDQLPRVRGANDVTTMSDPLAGTDLADRALQMDRRHGVVSRNGPRSHILPGTILILRITSH
jgi:hypothetical protein